MFRLESSYTNTTFRQQIQVDIILCNNQTNPNCKPRQEQEKFLQNFYFTMYLLKEALELTEDNFGEVPIKTVRDMNSQFMLQPHLYRD